MQIPSLLRPVPSPYRRGIRALNLWQLLSGAVAVAIRLTVTLTQPPPLLAADHTHTVLATVGTVATVLCLVSAAMALPIMLLTAGKAAHAPAVRRHVAVSGIRNLLWSVVATFSVDVCLDTGWIADGTGGYIPYRTVNLSSLLVAVGFALALWLGSLFLHRALTERHS